ncbi:MAG: hypothetical protein M3372_05330, partial [Verrucomicrobiota bacterium]|nr:hypothetical protein [Verrucomicrobiota bacterium]
MTNPLNIRVLRLLRFAALSLAILLAGSAFAQLPAPAVPPVSATTAAATPPPGAPGMVTLQYPNSDVVDVLRLYETLTGKKMIMDNLVQGKVNIFIAKPVPREEAIRIIEINLLMNGYSLVPAQDDIVKVIGTGKNPRTAGVPIISDESLIPPGEQVISFLFKLRFADPMELQQVLQQYLTPPNPYTSFLALPKASAVLVTENSSVIRTLASIINQVDIPPAEVVSEFIKLERADVTKVIEMLKEVFDKGNQQGMTPGAPGGVRNVRPGMPPPPPGQPIAVEGDVAALTALSEDSVVVGKIKLAADVRTNRIHVITRPVNMPFIRRLIAEFDANVEFAKPVTRALRYISAADVLPVIVQALTEPGSNQQGGIEGGATNPNPGSPQNQQLQQRPSSSSSSAGDFGSGSGGGGLNVSEELSTQAVDTTPKAVTIGNAKIIADQRSNSIITLGNREVVVKVMKILDEMDISAPQVALSTVIGELRLNNDENFGLDYFLRAGNRAVGVSRNVRAPIPGGTTGENGVPTSGTGIFTPGGLLNFTQIANAAAGGANVYLAAGNTLGAIVTALQS